MTTPEFIARIKGVGGASALPLDPAKAEWEGPSESESSSAEPTTGVDFGPKVKKDLSANLPPRTALLTVTRTEGHDPEAFQLHGYFQQVPWDFDARDRKSQLKPQFMPSRDLEDTLDSAVECYSHFLNWSVGQYGLKKWIAELRRAIGNEVLRLVIWDDTDFGIPWELFRLDSTGGARTEWLGVAVQVVRWTSVHDESPPDQYSAVATHCSGGGILFYEDATIPVAPEHAFENQPYPRKVRADNMKDLFAKLTNASNKYGLVYVRAHGDQGNSLSTAKLADVPLYSFEWYELPALRESRPVVFLNACNSAAVVYGPSYRDSCRSFAEAFLRRRASAVIATLAEVPADSSSVLAEDFLGLAHVDGVNVSEFLWRRRVEYFDAVLSLVYSGKPSGPDDLTRRQKSAIRAFIYTSVFTYFGHPDSVLQLGA